MNEGQRTSREPVSQRRALHETPMNFDRGTIQNGELAGSSAATGSPTPPTFCRRPLQLERRGLSLLG